MRIDGDLREPLYPFTIDKPFYSREADLDAHMLTRNCNALVPGLKTEKEDEKCPTKAIS